jgi:ferredoxin/flavodoxin---NADP+ reductase
MENINVVADHLDLDEISQKDLENQGRTRKRFIDLMKQIEIKPGVNKSIEFKFFLNPVEVIGSPLEGIKFEKTKLTENLKTIGTGEFETIPCQMAFRSIGYKNIPMDEVPFDNQKGIIPNDKGRVGSQIYVSGWLKRGPVGVIATNITDAKETSECMIEDFESLKGETLGNEEFKNFLTSKNVEFITFHQFKKIDQFEVDSGKKCGKIRDKVTDIDEMINIAKK